MGNAAPVEEVTSPDGVEKRENVVSPVSFVVMIMFKISRI